MKTYIFLTSLLSAVASVSGHARIRVPKPLGYGTSPQLSGNAYNSPLRYDGSDFPCKGLHNTMDLTPVATWQAGGQAFFEIQPNDDPNGGEGQLAAHSGGSCQISLSFDKGKSFKVLHSYEGGCPRDVRQNSNIAGKNQTFTFNVPASTRSGQVLAAWSWIANTGNRGEFYMNCASVNIQGTGTSTLNSYPDMWVGDLIKAPIAEGMCKSTGGTNLAYPNPGENVTRTGATTPAKGPGPDGTFKQCRAPGSPDGGADPNPGPSSSSKGPTPTTTSKVPTGTGKPTTIVTPTQNPPTGGEAVDFVFDGVTYSCMKKKTA